MSKRRGNGEGALYRRGDGRWVAQVDTGRGENGRRRYVRRVRRTKAQAIEALREIERLVAGGIIPDATTTVADWLSWWLEHVVYDLAPTSLATYRSIVARWIVPHVGAVPVQKLTPSHVQAMLAALDRQGLSPRSRQKARVVLVSALRIAERDGLVPRNVAQLVDGPKLGAKIDDALAADEARAVLSAAAGQPLEAAAVLGLRLGLRIGEVATLRWADVDLDANTLTVVKAKTRAGERTLPLVAGSAAALQSRRRHQAVERLAVGPLWADGGFVFTNPVGGQISTASLRKWWHGVVAEAGVPRRRFHASRHTAATLMLDDGIPLEVVSAALGHSSLAITSDVYAKVSMDAKRRALSQLDALLGQ